MGKRTRKVRYCVFLCVFVCECVLSERGREILVFVREKDGKMFECVRKRKKKGR